MGIFWGPEAGEGIPGGPGETRGKSWSKNRVRDLLKNKNGVLKKLERTQSQKSGGKKKNYERPRKGERDPPSLLFAEGLGGDVLWGLLAQSWPGFNNT